MKNSFLFVCLLVFQVSFAQNLRTALFELPDVVFKKSKSLEGYSNNYELSIKQPLDHQNPEAGFFYQRVFLSHLDFDKPMVIVTNGYSKSRNGITEVARLLKANQLSVEHRYFGKSLPDSIDYQYLNLEQSTADYHRIREIFADLYAQDWISTGISKGGQTTLMYRYFFPDDVKVSIPYVAPINLSLEDQRIYQFLDTVGTDACRAQLKEIQLRLLQEREEVIPLLRWYSYGAQLHFNYLQFEQAFEYQVLEYPFAFWQWGGSCEDLPALDEPIDSLLYHLVTVSGLDFFADESMKTYASHYYQAGAQMGYYGYDLKDFKPWIKALDTSKNPSAVFMPKKMKVDFDNSTILKAKKWLEEKGDRIIYINGNKDTWSATAMRPNKKQEALWFFLADQDHAGARIKNMNETEKNQLIKALEKWLDLEIDAEEKSITNSKP